MAKAKAEKTEGVSTGKLYWVSDPELVVIQEDLNDRTDFDVSDSFKKSIADEGVLVPVLCERKNGVFLLRDGERRVRAWKELVESGLDIKLPVVLGGKGDEQKGKLTMAIANFQRKDFDPVEESALVAQLLAWKWKPKKIADKFNRSVGWVSQRKQLSSVASAVKEALKDEHITLDDAMAIAKLDDWDAQVEELNSLYETDDSSEASSEEGDDTETDTQETSSDDKPKKKRKKRKKKKSVAGKLKKPGKKDVKLLVKKLEDTAPEELQEVVELISFGLNWAVGEISKEEFILKFQETLKEWEEGSEEGEGEEGEEDDDTPTPPAAPEIPDDEGEDGEEEEYEDDE